MKRQNLLLLSFCLLTFSFSLQATWAQVGLNNNIKNPNLATLEELTAIPLVSADLAEKMIEYQPFLDMVVFNGFLQQYLDEAKIKELYQTLFVPIDLNIAHRGEILFVPGIGDRMAHEFEEYRPYKALAQFRREMGKYVDDDEVARMEQFVYVPININTASDEDILSIPGVGNRMLHEFKEYRPYIKIEQFRREMGKYVDEKEVSRLERYIIL